MQQSQPSSRVPKTILFLSSPAQAGIQPEVTPRLDLACAGKTKKSLLLVNFCQAKLKANREAMSAIRVHAKLLETSNSAVWSTVVFCDFF